MQMKTFNLLLFFSFLFICSACSNESKEIVTEQKAEIVQEVSEVSTLASLSKEMLDSLFSQANSLEGTFYNSGKSVSLWDDNVKGVIAMMINTPPVSLKTTNLVGHVMILKKDKISAETIAYVEIFLAGSDSYAIFKIEEQKYYHTFNAKGLQFFEKMASLPPSETKQ